VLVKWSDLLSELSTWEDEEGLRQEFPGAPAWGQVVPRGGRDVTNAGTPVATDAVDPDSDHGPWERRRWREPAEEEKKQAKSSHLWAGVGEAIAWPGSLVSFSYASFLSAHVTGEGRAVERRRTQTRDLKPSQCGIGGELAAISRSVDRSNRVSTLLSSSLARLHALPTTYAFPAGAGAACNLCKPTAIADSLAKFYSNLLKFHSNFEWIPVQILSNLVGSEFF